MTKKQFALRFGAAVLSFVLLWFSAGLIDYMRAVCFYKEPVFCMDFGTDENGGFYKGLGYTYAISGNFDYDSPAEYYGAQSVELWIFGQKIKTVLRYEERSDAE